METILRFVLSRKNMTYVSKKQSDSDKLPPTLAALKETVFRVHFITRSCKFSDYGWNFKEKEKIFEPIMTSLTPTPENLIHITVCNCETKCITNRTKCRKNGLNCSEMSG